MIKVYTKEFDYRKSNDFEEKVNRDIVNGFEIVHISTVAGSGFDKITQFPKLIIVLQKK